MGHLVRGGPPALLGPASRDIPHNIERLDPRARLLAVAIFALTTVCLHSFAALIFAFMLPVALMLYTRMPLKRTLRRMAAMDSFIIFMMVTMPFTVPVAVGSEPVFTLLGLPASADGFGYAARIALRANAIVLMMMSLAGSMEPADLGAALHRMRMPAQLVQLMLFISRYVEVLNDEFKKLRTAMKARGFKAGNNRHTYISLGQMIGMMLIRALERSERVHMAMKCRGWDGGLHLLHENRFGRIDLLFAILVTALLLLLFTVDIHFGGQPWLR